jgi:hypothetical protein
MISIDFPPATTRWADAVAQGRPALRTMPFVLQHRRPCSAFSHDASLVEFARASLVLGPVVKATLI